jgi:WXG100 family type VII secretion target
MAKPDVRMNYESMETMASAFFKAAEQLDETMGEMQKVAQQMEGGALVGQGGSAFVDAIQSQLVPAMNIMRDKLSEMGEDINAAVKFTRDGVESARSKFF